MQLTLESSAVHIIRACEPGRVRIGETWHMGHLIVSPDRILTDWAPGPPTEWAFEDLSLPLTLEPEILLLGAGSHAPVPSLELMARLASAGVGLELMTTAAACRTYNVLAHERRSVVAALYNPNVSSLR